MPLKIVRDDLVNMSADAIVLPSNNRLHIGGGAGEAVARKAGLLRVRHACRKLGGCPIGSAASTPAFSFPARYLIHAAGPVWNSGPDDARLLRSAYSSSLQLAHDLGCKSVAMPLLSAGSYGCPAHISLSIALSEIEAFLAEGELDVTLVLFDKKAVAASLDFLGELESRIDDAYVETYAVCEAARSRDSRSFGEPLAFLGKGARFGKGAGEPPSAALAMEDLESLEAAQERESLENRLGKMDAGFSRTLLTLIDESGMTDAQVYRKANMSRQHFSKIRSNAGYHPSKATVLALCIALELDLHQTRDLLSRAGYTFSHASKFDIIVEYFIEQGIYDQFKINETLFYFDQPLLGG